MRSIVGEAGKTSLSGKHSSSKYPTWKPQWWSWWWWWWYYCYQISLSHKKDGSKEIDQSMKSLISTSEYFDKSAINIFSGPTVQDILFCSLKSSAVRIVAKLDLLCGRIRGGLDFRIFDLRISHLIFIWISMHYTYDFMFSGSLVIDIGCYRKNIARIANAVQVTICLLMSTSVY